MVNEVVAANQTALGNACCMVMHAVGLSARGWSVIIIIPPIAPYVPAAVVVDLSSLSVPLVHLVSGAP